MANLIKKNTPDQLKPSLCGLLGVKFNEYLSVETIIVNYVINEEAAKFETKNVKWSKLDNIKQTCKKGDSLLGPEVYRYLFGSIHNQVISIESFEAGNFKIDLYQHGPKSGVNIIFRSL